MTQKLVFETVDPETNCYITQQKIELESPIEQISKTLCLGKPSELFSCIFDLELNEIQKLAEFPDFERINVSYPARLRPFNRLDSLPYNTHTGRELRMMLEGIKPLSSFNYLEGEDVNSIISQPFTKYVQNDGLVSRHYVQKGDPDANDWQSKDIHNIMYALPQEEWRMDCMWMLIRARSKGFWDAEMERFEGELLGYSDEENRIYLEHFY